MWLSSERKAHKCRLIMGRISRIPFMYAKTNWIEVEEVGCTWQEEEAAACNEIEVFTLWTIRKGRADIYIGEGGNVW